MERMMVVADATRCTNQETPENYPRHAARSRLSALARIYTTVQTNDSDCTMIPPFLLTHKIVDDMLNMLKCI